MPSLIDLRRRVRAMKNTQQITKAMKMVSASKLRRAQERVVSARPFASQMQRVLRSVASRVDPSVHPLLTVRERRPDSRTLVIVVTADKGLCGSFNTNVIKGAAAFVGGSAEPCVMGLVGRRGRDFFVRRRFDAMFERIGISEKPAFAHAQDISELAIESFTSGKVDRVMLVYNEFKSVISQRVVVDQLLPIAHADVEGAPGMDEEPASHAAHPTHTGGNATAGERGSAGSQIDYLYEPSAAEIFEQLLPRYVDVQVYRALLESAAAFFAAQMTAMDTATKNAADLIASLTLYMNKVRQAAITREIIEVVSGAQAL